MKFIEDIAEEAGAPADGLKLVFVLLMLSPLGLLFRGLRSPTLRHLFSAATGLAGALYVYGPPALISLASSLVVYAMLAVLPRPYLVPSVWVFTFGLMISAHAHRHWVDPTILWDGAQMILTLKLVSLAVNYQDRDEPKNAFRVQRLPSLLEYFGFVYFYCGFLAGPAIEFSDYMRMVAPSKEAREATPSPPWSVHLVNLARVAASAVMFGLAGMFPLSLVDEHLRDPELGRPLWLTVVYSCLAVTLYRGRYYLCWSLGEMAGAWGGLGYDPAKDSWTALRGHNMHLVELPPSMRAAINNWNILTSVWLNRYVYQRVFLGKNGKPTGLSTAAVFTVSAFWHGLNSGYYVFFLTGALFLETAKGLRRRLRHLVHSDAHARGGDWAFLKGYADGSSKPWAVLYDLAGVVGAVVFLAYAGMSFEIEEPSVWFAVWRSYYFAPHVICFALMALFNTVWRAPSSAQSSKKTS